MDVIVMKPFTVIGKNGSMLVDIFEHGKVISGFGFLKVQFNKTGDEVFHADESVLGRELMSHAEFHTTFKDNPKMMKHLANPIYLQDFLSAEDMTI